MLNKPDEPPHEITSYRPLSFLSILSKLFEKLLLKRLKPLIKTILLDFQFRFRTNSTIEQVQHVITHIVGLVRKDNYCSTVFLDVAQAFDKAWHEGLTFKLSCMLLRNYCQLLESYLINRQFRV